MKPFDLEKALAGDPVVTKSGRKVIELIKLEKRKRGQIIAVLEDDLSCNDTDRISVCNIDGSSYSGEGHTLLMAAKTRKYYMNIYRSKSQESGFSGANIYSNKEDCIKDGTAHRFTTVEFEIEE